MQVFILPFAGGNSYSFHFLKPHFSPASEVHVLELPGRGKRMKEALLKTSDEAIEDYCLQIKNLRMNLKTPYVIYGHSMGTLLGLAVVRKLEELADPPLRFVGTGSAGPGVTTDLDTLRHQMDDHQLKEELLRLGGAPRELLEDQDMFAFFSKPIRSDFEILYKSIRWDEVMIRTSAFFVMGNDEMFTNKISNWKKYATGITRFALLPGDHFFIHKHPDRIAALIEKGESALEGHS
ncbi:Surfactin synthase thioesterase subunit [compost metagenome]